MSKNLRNVRVISCKCGKLEVWISKDGEVHQFELTDSEDESEIREAEAGPGLEEEKTEEKPTAPATITNNAEPKSDDKTHVGPCARMRAILEAEAAIAKDEDWELEGDDDDDDDPAMRHMQVEELPVQSAEDRLDLWLLENFPANSKE